MKNIFYIECSGAHWLETATKLNEKHDWNPCYWTAAENDEIAVKKKFPSVIFQKSVNASKNILSDELTELSKLSNATIDNKLMDFLAATQCHSLHMMDRMDASGSDFPYRARLSHFHSLVSYWLKILDIYKPDIIVFSISPHMAFDLIIYELANYFGIQCLMFERTALPKSLFVIDNFRAKPKHLLAAYKKAQMAKKTSSNKIVKAFLDASRSTGNNIPINFQKKVAAFKLNKTTKNDSIFTLAKWCVFELKRAAYAFYKYGRNASSTNHYVKYFPKKGLCSLSTVQLTYVRFKALFKKFKLKKYYARLCKKKPFDKGRPYVFFALHYQPERATLPLGDFYASQELIVDLIASQLPKGWQLAIKEHPWQLQSYSRGELQREYAFYDRISTHKNVAIIPLEEDSNSLILSAEAVATITGSVGWQAICQSIPCLSFGYNWYRLCEGVFSISTKKNLSDALTKIQRKNYTIDQSKVDAFAVALDSVSTSAVLEFSIEYADGLDESTAATNMAKALYDYVQHKNCKSL